MSTTTSPLTLGQFYLGQLEVVKARVPKNTFEQVAQKKAIKRILESILYGKASEFEAKVDNIIKSGKKILLFITDGELDDFLAIKLADIKCCSGPDPEFIPVFVTCLRNPNVVATQIEELLLKPEYLVMPGVGGIKPEWFDPSGKFVLPEAAEYDADVHAYTHEMLVKLINGCTSTVTIFGLAVLTDLADILHRINDPASKIDGIYCQTGDLWREDMSQPGGIGYNLATKMPATHHVMTMCSMYGVPGFAAANGMFAAPDKLRGGSVRHSEYPDLIDALKASTVPGVAKAMEQGVGWDLYMRDGPVPALKAVAARIGADLTKQFTPADPIVVILFLMLLAAKREADPTTSTSYRSLLESLTREVWFNFTPDGKKMHVVDRPGSSIYYLKDINVDIVIDFLWSLTGKPRPPPPSLPVTAVPEKQ